MRRKEQGLASVFLSTAVIVLAAAPALRGQQGSEVPQADQQRVYDSAHKDYHIWDAREDEAYRRWLDEEHEPYVYHGQLSEKTQRDYWRWRHKDMKHERRTQPEENQHPQ
jgi:uncharacterized protein YecT (DUF1311 family)